MDFKNLFSSLLGHRPSHSREPFTEPRGTRSRQNEAFDDVPRYPPFSRGLPVVSGKRLVNDQMELITRIKQAAGVGDDLFTSQYLSVIHRYVDYVHLLPASERHHHRGAGGLLRHGLEVAHYALQLSDTVLWSQNEPPSIRSKLKPRWRLACFCAALAHDLGKPVSDVEVVNRDGTQIWNPFGETLVEWSNRNEIDRVFLRWRETRHRRHETLTPLICERIIGKDIFFYLSEGQPDILKDLMESVVGAGNHKINHIARIVAQSDSESVAKDLREMRLSGDADYGVPVERHLIDAMRSQIKSGQWEINKPGSMVWHLSEGLFLVWPKAAHSCRTLLNKQGVPGIPTDPDTIAEILLERGLAEYCTPNEGSKHNLWHIKPEVGTASVITPALKLASAELLIDPPPPIAHGSVVNPSEPKDKEDVSPTKTGEKEASTSSSVTNNEPTSESSTRKNAAKTTPQTGTHPNEGDVPSDPFDGKEPEDWLEKQGKFSRFLKAIASDIANGKSKWGERAVVLEAEAIAIKWPESVEGYGFEPGDLLQRGITEGLVIADQMERMKKQMFTCKDLNGSRALRIAGTPAIAFIAVAKAPPKNKTQQERIDTPAPKPHEEKKTHHNPNPAPPHKAPPPPDNTASTEDTVRKLIEDGLKMSPPAFRIYQDGNVRQADYEDFFAWLSEKTGEKTKKSINGMILSLGFSLAVNKDQKRMVVNLSN